MHPLITRYLDPTKLIATIEKAQQAVALDADEAALIAQLENEPKFKAEILKAKGRAQTPSQVQQQAIVVSVRAATARLLDDDTLGPKARAAMAALEAEGASGEEARMLVSQVLLDEAFGYAEDPGEFDRPYVAETLESLLALAKVNAELVDEWLETWAKKGPAGDKALRVTVAEALLDSAWNEGPTPIAPEHVDDALDHLSDTVASGDRVKAFDAMRAFIGYLDTQGVIGKERSRRLITLVDAAATGPVDSEEEIGEDAEEDE